MITTRKINQVRNSFYVYLPRKWCNEFKITKKSEVKIEHTPEGALRIHPPDFKVADSNILHFTVDEDTRSSIVNLLVGAYIVGVHGIKIEFGETLDLETRENVSKWIRRLPGFEILDEDGQSFEISDTSEKQVITPIIKRQFSTTKYMLNSFIDAVKSGEYGETSRILDRDVDVNRHRYFVERLCHLALKDPAYARKIAIKASDALHFSLAAKYVERVADHICAATTAITKLKSLSKQTIKLAFELIYLFDSTTKTFFSVDSLKFKGKESIAKESKNAFNSLHEAKDLVTKLSKVESSKTKAHSNEAILLLHLQRIASYCADIEEVAINRIIEHNQ